MTTLTAPERTPDAETTGAALGHLFDDHGRMVLGICRIYLEDPYEAEDAAQETFVSAHRSLLSGRQPDLSGPWLAAIARNECRDRIRGSARRNTTAAPQEMFERLPDTQSDAIADNIDRGASLHAALSDLPEAQREAFVMREVLGLRYDEIANALETSESAVESLLVRARKTLRTHLGGKRLAPAALVVPFALRESLAHAVPGFPAAQATAGGVAASASGTGAATSGSTGGSTAAGTTQGVGVQGAASSGSLGANTGASGALGGSTATTSSSVAASAGATATTAAASGSAAASSVALAGVTKVLATPILAKLAIAGATATVALTSAASKPWQVEPQSSNPPIASELALPAGDVAGVRTNVALGDGASAAGAGIGLADGTSGVETQAQAPKKPAKPAKAKKAKGGAKQSTTPAPTPEATAEPTPVSDPSPPPTSAGNTGGNPDPPESGQGSSPEDSQGPGAASAGQENTKKSNGKGKKRGHEEDGPGNSNNAPGTNKAEAPQNENADDSGNSNDNGNGKKLGHEEDGPGNSNNAPGQSKKKEK